MNHQTNAAAIDRLNLVAQMRATQCALSAHAGRRFDSFFRTLGGAIYELPTYEAVEHAFSRFEWVEIDRLYTDIFLRLTSGEAAGPQSAGTAFREVRIIVRDKLHRIAGKWPGRIFKAALNTAFLVLQSVMFMTISSIVSEACLHYLHPQ